MAFHDLNIWGRRRDLKSKSACLCLGALRHTIGADVAVPGFPALVDIKTNKMTETMQQVHLGNQ